MNEIWIARLLRAGVGISLALVTLGTILTFLHHPGYLTDPEALKHLTGERAQFPRTLSGELAALKDFTGQGVVTMGLLVLIATPFVRVAFSAATFWRERDRVYTGITLVVLGLLTFSLVIGKAG